MSKVITFYNNPEIYVTPMHTHTRTHTHTHTHTHTQPSALYGPLLLLING